MSILYIKDLHYKVDRDHILKGISLEIQEGECISIVGSSGSGKSTLLKMCADLIPITQGDIFFRNKSYKEYSPLDLRKKISYCVQIPYLFGEKVMENLEFPFKVRKEKTNRSRILELINIFNLDESVLDKDINSLSGGEKQRIAIARNLIYTPEVLLLDEATASLDKENASNIEEYIKSINKQGVTIVWVTHSEEQSKSIFTKKISMTEGKIVDIHELI